VQAIVALTRTLRMRAIGEGIETAAQYARLRALGCDLGQGYYIARPMSADAAEQWLAESAIRSLTTDHCASACRGAGPVQRS
jgi:EAL domain-containing protein (putative c-di-GMP-specific phosphodiesterase class I)